MGSRGGRRRKPLEPHKHLVLTEEPDVTPLRRFQNMLLAPFVPEQQP